MKFIHPANEDFIQQGQGHLRAIISENQINWPASACYQLGLFLRLWTAGFFFKAGDTDATPLLNALVVADKIALAHPPLVDWLNARNLSVHLRMVQPGGIDILTWSMKAIIAGEAIYRALVCLFPNQIKIKQDAKRVSLTSGDRAFVFNFAHPEQITITNEPGYIPLTLDIVDGDPNPFIKFDGSWLENEIVRHERHITEVFLSSTNTPPEPPPLTGAALIAAEYEYQMSKKGHSAKGDDKHVNRELVKCAVYYALGNILIETHELKTGIISFERALPSNLMARRTSNEMENLAKAGALIAAEIDRLQRIKS